MKSGVIRFRREDSVDRRPRMWDAQVKFVGPLLTKADRCDRYLFICGGRIFCMVQPRNPANPRLVVYKERRSGTLIMFASGM